jgi:hypothetical protein
MLMAFVDESSNAIHYRTLGLVVQASKVRALRDGLDGLIDDVASKNAAIERTTELHGHDLFQATEDWRSLRAAPRSRISVYRRALEVVAANAEAALVEGLDRRLFRERYADDRDEHVATLLHLLEKLDRYARRRGDDLVVVADEHHTALAAQEALRATRTGPTWGYRGRPQSLLDTVYFVSSTMSRPVQAADMVAYLHQRISDVVETDGRAAAANAGLWSIVEPLLHADRVWRPVDAQHPPPDGGG